MKTLNYTFRFIIMFNVVICICVGCQRHSDSDYFNGEIRQIEDTVKNIEPIKLKSVHLDGANHGWMAVYDSLIFFMNPKLSDCFYQIFNVNTGEEIGTFCRKGSGPDEVTCLGPIFQFVEEGNELKTLLFTPNEEKVLIWNITQSIGRKEVIWDVNSYTWRKENNNACYHQIFLQSKNTLLAKVDAFPINDKDATLPYYQKRTINTNKCLKDYTIYKKSIVNEDAPIIPIAFFGSNDALKPDGTKIAQAMTHVPQLNIINTESGKVTGYRLGEGDFSVFKGRKQINTYYIGVHADDNYIYALYWGKEPWGNREIPFVNIIHVFDWNGNLVRKMSMDHGIDNMWIDTVRNRLYTTDPNTDDVFYCDLNKN